LFKNAQLERVDSLRETGLDGEGTGGADVVAAAAAAAVIAAATAAVEANVDAEAIDISVADDGALDANENILLAAGEVERLIVLSSTPYSMF